jgi:hypothetical protein
LLPQNTAALWGQLTQLFQIIDLGNPSLGVTTFNGGLFNPQRHPFLGQYAVGDRHLQLAIEKLACVDGEFVDYRDLAERHLGTIYEGLLEFHLEAMAKPEDGWSIEIKFDRYGQHKGDKAGFDVVIGNPPYVRQEELGPFKPYFAAKYPQTYDGVADLYIYFYQQGFQLTHAGGRMSYIVTNKWMRSGYGLPLRTFFAQTGALERVIDFGHAPIFEDAEVFPCILVLNKPHQRDEEEVTERQVQVLNFPREELSRIVQAKHSLGGSIRAQSQSLPHSRFSSAAWHLEASVVENLLTKIRRVGVPLTEFVGVKPYRGVLTGLNEAFLIDTPTKNRLVREDPRSAQILKPYLRGQDIKRWSPQWAGLWMIALKSSGDYEWP